jgi:hypothetical protein
MAQCDPAGVHISCVRPGYVERHSTYAILIHNSAYEILLPFRYTLIYSIAFQSRLQQITKAEI